MRCTTPNRMPKGMMKRKRFRKTIVIFNYSSNVSCKIMLASSLQLLTLLSSVGRVIPSVSTKMTDSTPKWSTQTMVSTASSATSVTWTSTPTVVSPCLAASPTLATTQGATSTLQSPSLLVDSLEDSALTTSLLFWARVICCLAG